MLRMLLWAMLIYLIMSMFLNRKMQAGNPLIDLVKKIKDRNEFFTAADELIASDDVVTANKARCVKLWGLTYHEEYDSFEQLVNEINPDELISGDKITDNEDSFFYLLLGIPNMLAGKGRNEELKLLQEKMQPYREKLKNQMVVLLSEGCDHMYAGEPEEGRKVFERILEGEYEGYSYNKQLIGLYKQICAAELINIYKETGETEKIDDLKDLVQEFANSGVGQRWIANIGLADEFLTDSPEEDTESEGKE